VQFVRSVPRGTLSIVWIEEAIAGDGLQVRPLIQGSNVLARLGEMPQEKVWSAFVQGPFAVLGTRNLKSPGRECGKHWVESWKGGSSDCARASLRSPLRLRSVETLRTAELRSAGPFDVAQGKLPRALIPTWALLAAGVSSPSVGSRRHAYSGRAPKAPRPT
jgi:hypothetical protein